jgi:hypothetical protein
MINFSLCSMNYQWVFKLTLIIDWLMFDKLRILMIESFWFYWVLKFNQFFQTFCWFKEWIIVNSMNILIMLFSFSLRNSCNLINYYCKLMAELIKLCPIFEIKKSDEIKYRKYLKSWNNLSYYIFHSLELQ